MKPQRKVVAGGAGGAATLVLVWVLGQFGVDVPPEVAVAMSTLISFGAAYVTKSKGSHAA